MKKREAPTAQTESTVTTIRHRFSILNGDKKERKEEEREEVKKNLLRWRKKKPRSRDKGTTLAKNSTQDSTIVAL